MRITAIAVALLLAACGSATAPTSETPLPPDAVVLATFTGEVDTAAGTFVVRNDESATSLRRSGMVIPESATTVTIANSGAAWNNTVRTGKCGGAPVTGANVVVTQKYPSPTILGAVYAEITSVSAAGMSACNSAVAPSGLGVSAQYGLWSHGSTAWGLVNGMTNTATTEWNFVTSTTTRFTFQGRIVALRGTVLSGFGTSNTAFGAIQDTGTRMVYARSANTLQFINYDGTSGGQSATLPGNGYDLAVNANWIWFTTSGGANNYVGNMPLDGTAASWVQAEPGYTGSAARIRPDPNDSTRAFYTVANAPNSTRTSLFYVTAGTPPVVTPVAAITMTTPGDFVFGSNGNLFLVATGTNAILEYTKEGVLVNNFQTGASCQGPTGITRTTAGTPATDTFWFTTSSSSNRICKLVPTGSSTAVVTAVATCSLGKGMATDADNNVWATCNNSVLRVTPDSTATLNSGSPSFNTLYTVATSSGLVWSSVASNVYRWAY